MFGCSLWNLAAVFFMSGELPIHEKKLTSVGLVGSLTGPSPCPCWLLSLLDPESPPQAARPVEARARIAMAAGGLNELESLTEPAPSCDAVTGFWSSHGEAVQIVWLPDRKDAPHANPLSIGTRTSKPHRFPRARNANLQNVLVHRRSSRLRCRSVAERTGYKS